MSRVERVVYQIWSADNQMSADRSACFETGVKNIGVPVRLVTPSNISEYVVPAHPLHPAYEYLTPTHRADYLRSYLLHFHGGGYADIKWYTENNNWAQSFDVINANPEVDAVGTLDPNVGGANPAYARDDVSKYIIVLGFMIMRPGSELSTAYFTAVENYLTVQLRNLKRHHSGAGPYPIPWVGIGLNLHYACRDVASRRPEAIRMGLRSGWDTSVKYR